MRITIDGQAASGKTTVASYIQEALTMVGITSSHGTSFSKQLGEVDIITFADPTHKQVADLRHLHKEHPLGVSVKEALESTTATLKNAMLMYEDRVNGNCYGDKHGRFPDGMNITTSKVVRVEGDIVHTKSGNSYKCEWFKPEERHKVKIACGQ